MRKTRSIHKLYEILEESRDRNAIRNVSRKLSHLRTSGLPGHYKGSVLPGRFTRSLVKQSSYDIFTPYEKPNPDSWRVWVGPFGDRGNFFVDEHGMWSTSGFTRGTQLQDDYTMWELFHRGVAGDINTRSRNIPIRVRREDEK